MVAAVTLAGLAAWSTSARFAEERESIVVIIACDDRADVYINGSLIAQVEQWETPLRLDVSADGAPVVVGVRAENTDGPAGLLAIVRRGGALGQPEEETAQWLCSYLEEADWHLPAFDDGHWQPPETVAAYGSGPWGDQLDLDLEAGEWVWPVRLAGSGQTIYCRWRIAK